MHIGANEQHRRIGVKMRTADDEQNVVRSANSGHWSVRSVGQFFAKSDMAGYGDTSANKRNA
jgi:hypothetical protein